MDGGGLSIVAWYRTLPANQVLRVPAAKTFLRGMDSHEEGNLWREMIDVEVIDGHTP